VHGTRFLMFRVVGLLGAVALSGCMPSAVTDKDVAPSPAEITSPRRTLEAVDAEVHRMMADTGAKGLALAVIDQGVVRQVSVYGARNAVGDPLQRDTIMYGASLTKMTFGYMVAQLAEEGLIDLDRSITDYLPQPLPAYIAPEIEDDYARWSDLAGDDRWKRLTPRLLLNHASGFANFGFLEPDGKLRFHFDPGAQYGYSGDGIILLQFVLEKGLGLDVGQELQRRIFDPLGMKNTSLIWRDDFKGRTADGWTIEGRPEPHDDRSRVRAAGSMDTTIDDMALLTVSLVNGDRLSAKAYADFLRPQLHITTKSQFPTPQKPLPAGEQRADLYAALGPLVFEGPQGKGFVRGGHNDSTGNMITCLENGKRCVVILGNDLRAEAAIPYLTDFILGETNAPWDFMFGDLKLWKPA
jgi:CubicO group peptidase (beta-lactamase class C family)